MKQIKLDARYTLWQHGFRYALKFDNWRDNLDIIHSLQDAAGRDANGRFNVLGHHGKKIKGLPMWAYNSEYFLAFKTEAEVTAALLQINNG